MCSLTKSFYFFPATHLVTRGYQQQFSTKSHLHGPGKKPQRCYSSQPALGRVGAAGPHRLTHSRGCWPHWHKGCSEQNHPLLLGRLLLPSVKPFPASPIFLSSCIYLALLNTAVYASLLSICCFHTKKGLKTLLRPEYAHEALQHTSYMRNSEIRDFGEAQETFTRSSKLLVEMLTASLKTTGSQLKTNRVRNIYSHTIEHLSASRKVP